MGVCIARGEHSFRFGDNEKGVEDELKRGMPRYAALAGGIEGHRIKGFSLHNVDILTLSEEHVARRRP